MSKLDGCFLADVAWRMFDLAELWGLLLLIYRTGVIITVLYSDKPGWSIVDSMALGLLGGPVVG